MQAKDWIARENSRRAAEGKSQLSLRAIYRLCAAVAPELPATRTNQSAFITRQIESIFRPDADWVNRWYVISAGDITSEDWHQQHLQKRRQSQREAA